MIIHSIVPTKTIFDNLETIEQPIEYISYGGEVIEVAHLNNEEYRVNRIISTNLSSYLNPNIQPGATINVRIKDAKY